MYTIIQRNPFLPICSTYPDTIYTAYYYQSLTPSYYPYLLFQNNINVTYITQACYSDIYKPQCLYNNYFI